MEEQLNPLAVTHLLQHTLRSLCIHDNAQWVYAVFWRILPRNYPPPKWDFQGGPYDRTRGNRRNWILVWEDGFCNFAASSCEQAMIESTGCPGSSSAYGDCEPQKMKGLQPELFFKMSHEIYNYGEGLIGKVAADYSHKWVFKEPQDNEINLLSSWNNPADSYPRTWEAQFQSGIKTIALIAVREGVVQLGAINKVMEDLSYVVLLRKKFSYLESIPGVLLPHPSSAAFPPVRLDGCNAPMHGPAIAPPMEMYDHFSQQGRITPSMSSLEALLAKLPSVGPAAPSSSTGYYEMPPGLVSAPTQRPPMGAMGMERVAKEETEEEDQYGNERGREMGGESSSSISYFVDATKPGEGF
ncbi:protein RICE SALT SENSITIVE 3 isoform X2 [Elaeis guineensis]|uniref:Protein RICE SALT SENSITIVE 3 isoform X2 n=1 Tax=Elaeis guineensis var. tenera TaxID=51953 RepID=A0A6I9QQ90_ELAGV|nr:protein RICE SALT SENSITIVE 3 isoform X2 [Elaeis guineensis]